MENLIKETKKLKEENEALKKKNELLMTILDVIDEGVYAVDENEIITLYNSTTERIEQRQRSEMLGKDEKIAYLTEQKNYYYDHYTSKVKKTKKPIFNALYRFHREDGKPYSIIIDLIPFFYQGEYAGIYSIGHDEVLLRKTYTNALEMQEHLLPGKNQKNVKLYTLDDIIGGKKMQEIIKLAKRTALHESPVMIVGETGTGKEMFAQGIHAASLYREGPFVPINCAAIPETLLESTLFGTIKGAFTGSVDMPGLFEQAEGGTIFLDEINSMALTFQAKLLRVIQEKKVRRVGSQKEIPINCRIISATNSDPFVNTNTFRPDLFFRLAVVNLKLPALRERPEDIILLAEFFIKRLNNSFFTSIQGIDDELKRILFIYTWPGNVRELENIIESSMNFVEKGDTVLRLEHIPQYFIDRMFSTRPLTNVEVQPSLTLRAAIENFEKKMILDALENNNWNISRSARQLGMKRQNLQKKINEYDFMKP